MDSGDACQMEAHVSKMAFKFYSSFALEDSVRTFRMSCSACSEGLPSEETARSHSGGGRKAELWSLRQGWCLNVKLDAEGDLLKITFVQLLQWSHPASTASSGEVLLRGRLDRGVQVDIFDDRYGS